MSDRFPAVPADRLEAGGWTLRDRTTETLFRTPTATVEGHTVVYEDVALARALAAAGLALPAGEDGGILAGRRRSDEREGDGAGDAGDADGADATDGADGDPPADPDPWRFFFATRLSFSPPLPPAIGPATVLPTVTTEARRSFAEDLRRRGFRDVDRGRGERMRTDGGDRARLTKYTARVPVTRADGTDADGAAPDPVPVEGFLAVWTTGGSFRVAGGAHPASDLHEVLPPTADGGGDGGGDGDGDPPEADPRRFRDELLDLIRAVE